MVASVARSRTAVAVKSGKARGEARLSDRYVALLDTIYEADREFMALPDRDPGKHVEDAMQAFTQLEDVLLQLLGAAKAAGS